MINYLIIDDEYIAHNIIKEYCELLPDMLLAKQCYDAFEAIQFLRTETVELIFLDLNLPKLKGFDFLKSLPSPPKVIVTTAYREYALQGYELNVIDYLLKPFSFERFLQAINKVNLTNFPKSTSGSVEDSAEKEDLRLFLYSNKKHHQVKVSSILFVEAAGNYSKVQLTDQMLPIRGTLKNSLAMLPPEQFIQVHKSFIVAKNHIDHVEGNLIYVKDKSIPIGKNYRAIVEGFIK